MRARVEVRLPDLGLPEEQARLTVWLAAVGDLVERGDPLLEVTAGPVTIDLPAPVSGQLVECLAAEDDPLAPGDPLAFLESDG